MPAPCCNRREPKEWELIEIRKCVTCGDELHPERAEKYDYCTKPECRRRNARGLRVAAVAVNKAADQFVLLNEQTAKEAGSGRYKKQPDAVGSSGSPQTNHASSGGKRVAQVVPRSPARTRTRPWSEAQRNLALTYRDMGLAPDAVAKKLGIPARVVTQILLAAPPRRR